MPQPRFEFYEKVRINSADRSKSHLNAKLAAVLGRTEAEDRKGWYYSAFVYSDGTVWCFFEEELEATGEHAQASDFVSGTSIRVTVDERGRGFIAPEFP